MTSDETTRQAARVIGSVMSRWDMHGRPDVDGGIDTLIARTLADAGLLAENDLSDERLKTNSDWQYARILGGN